MEKKDKKKGQWFMRLLGKWYFWAIASVVFLAGVQFAFVEPAPNKWFDAAWEAGDFISFVGTIILGYVAMRQTQYANKMAEDANNTSRKIIELQEEEYLPIVTVSNFAGITKHELSGKGNAEQSEMVSVEMRDKDNNVMVGYSFSILTDNTDLSQKTFCRDYEIHLQYSGRFVMSSFKIKSIKFCGCDFEKEYFISKSEEISLCDKEKLTLLMFVVSNEDFMQETTYAYKHLKAKRIVFEVEMISMQGNVYNETIIINKMLIPEPEAVLNQPNIEMLLSAAYKVNKM